ncbi:MAG: DNA polymerase III subunit gamma/tau [Candidatus Liptonbacteria bacterium]|nr:DNA polymerase III subunit gamma/tau [Candidatus Liptonbacteria bacterium]
MSLSFYRKYRPKTLGDLLGQETNRDILRSAAKQNRIGHAYLFYGPRGTGKTTTARILAKLLNCETRAGDAAFRAQGEPCNSCGTCIAIDRGTALDLIEIDAASNRGIDEIRNLKEGIYTSPAENQYKVYIIDEAHMLTREAMNALLKTLEEPPRHAALILATTEFEKLPPTITSRTQRFLFKKIPKQAIVEKLKVIADAERIRIEPAALELIAAAGEGSFRDAESLLDQIAAAEEHITLAAAERISGKAGAAKVRALAGLIFARDLKGSLAYLAGLHEEGQNIVNFTKDLIHYLRKAVTLKLNPSLEKFYRDEFAEHELSELVALASSADARVHIPFLKALIRAYGEMRYSPLAIVPIEIAIVEHLQSEA